MNRKTASAEQTRKKNLQSPRASEPLPGTRACCCQSHCISHSRYECTIKQWCVFPLHSKTDTHTHTHPHTHTHTHTQRRIRTPTCTHTIDINHNLAVSQSPTAIMLNNQ